MATQDTTKDRQSREAARREMAQDDRIDAPVAPGSVSTGAGIGTAAGVASGAALGAGAGPVGAAIGAVVGGVAGAIAGKGVHDFVDADEEDAFWKEEYSNRDYHRDDVSFEQLRPAYRAGYEGFGKYNAGVTPRSFDDVERDIKAEYESYKDRGAVSWDQARPAARDSYERVQQQYSDTMPPRS